MGKFLRPNLTPTMYFFLKNMKGTDIQHLSKNTTFRIYVTQICSVIRDSCKVFDGV